MWLTPCISEIILCSRVSFTRKDSMSENVLLAKCHDLVAVRRSLIRRQKSMAISYQSCVRISPWFRLFLVRPSVDPYSQPTARLHRGKSPVTKNPPNDMKSICSIVNRFPFWRFHDTKFWEPIERTERASELWMEEGLKLNNPSSCRAASSPESVPFRAVLGATQN